LGKICQTFFYHFLQYLQILTPKRLRVDFGDRQVILFFSNFLAKVILPNPKFETFANQLSPDTYFDCKS